MTMTNVSRPPPTTPRRRPSRSCRLTPSQAVFMTPEKCIPRSSKRCRPLANDSPLSCRRNKTPRTCRSDNDTGDRFIPSRRHLNLDLVRRSLLSGQKRQRQEETQATETDDDKMQTPLQKNFKRRMLSSLCNIPLESLDKEGEPKSLFSCQRYTNKVKKEGNIQNINPFSLDILRSEKLGDTENEMDASNAHFSFRKKYRNIPETPYMVLDGPGFADDYYLNLLSWSKGNILAVALSTQVWLNNPTTKQIMLLFETDPRIDEYITSVCWCDIPHYTQYVAVGTSKGAVHICDGEACICLRTIFNHTSRGSSHTSRVSSLAWNGLQLTSGGRDACIFNIDIRCHQESVSSYRGHNQEVCGLKWNDEGGCLASGGNDNLVCLWDVAMSGTVGSSSHLPRLILQEHKAAVKALDWCPFQSGLLASGGGTADGTIKFWDSSSGFLLNSVDTESQVSSILWSKHRHELVSSHGFSKNHLAVWDYPSMTKIKELKFHRSRVLGMSMSPDGSSVVSVSGDENICFWEIFGRPPPPSSRPLSGLLSLGGDTSFGFPTIR